MTEATAATEPTEIFLAALPGFEPLVAAEAREAGFAGVAEVPGGVTCRGGWPEVWRANLVLRGASRVLVRIGGFRAFHLAQLDKRARRFPWAELLAPGTPVKVETTCRRSKIYHAGAANERIGRAVHEALGAGEGPAEDALRLMARIEDDLVTFSLDTSGEPPATSRSWTRCAGPAPSSSRRRKSRWAYARGATGRSLSNGSRVSTPRPLLR